MRFIFLLLLFPMFSIAQFDTTKFYRSPNYGDLFRRVKINQLMIPNDTTTNKVGVAQIGQSLFLYNVNRWVEVGNFDSTSLSNRINLKLNISDTVSLSNRINTKLNISDTSNMLNAYKHWLAGYTPQTRTISTTAPLQGGGDLSANRTLSIDTANGSRNGAISRHDWTLFNNKYNLPSLTSGSVLFSNGTTISQDNSNLFWNNTTKRFGIGNNYPLAEFHLGNRRTNASVNARFLLADSIVNNSELGNAHGFADGSYIDRNNNFAYASFDGRIEVQGSNNYDHFAIFQSAPKLNQTSTILNNYGFYSTIEKNASGTITNHYDYYAANPLPISGTITNSYVLYSESKNRATNEYGIWLNGTMTNYFGGATTFNLTTTTNGTINANSVGGNFRFRGGNTTSLDGAILANGSGDLFFSNWDITRGLRILANGNANIVGSGSFTAQSIISNTTGTFAGTINANSVGGNFRFRGGNTTATDGGLFANGSGDIYFSNWDANRGWLVAANGNVQMLGTGLLQFGGTSASFPAIKRSTTSLQVRLANDTDFAPTQSLYQRFGTGSPEGVVTAPVGAFYSRTDGGAGTSLYVKESGTGNTGWVAK